MDRLDTASSDKVFHPDHYLHLPITPRKNRIPAEERAALVVYLLGKLSSSPTCGEVLALLPAIMSEMEVLEHGVDKKKAVLEIFRDILDRVRFDQDDLISEVGAALIDALVAAHKGRTSVNKRISRQICVDDFDKWIIQISTVVGASLQYGVNGQALIAIILEAMARVEAVAPPNSHHRLEGHKRHQLVVRIVKCSLENFQEEKLIDLPSSQLGVCIDLTNAAIPMLCMAANTCYYFGPSPENAVIKNSPDTAKGCCTIH